MNRPDISAIIATMGGGFIGFFVSHYDRLMAATLSAIGIAYMLWKWRREAKILGAQCQNTSEKS